MKTQYTVILAATAGFGLGALAIEGLHAQAKPPVYYVSEIDISDTQAYAKEYVPKAQALSKSSGARFLVQGGKVTPLEGAAPKSRIVIQQWDSLEKIQAWRSSKEFKEARNIGEKYAKFRSYAVEGVQQK
jgi:uncharacterized protein (DUF1330 family)